jgi:hypothetical protein
MSESGMESRMREICTSGSLSGEWKQVRSVSVKRQSYWVSESDHVGHLRHSSTLLL